MTDDSRPLLGGDSPERPKRWLAFRRRLSDEQRRDVLGQLYAEGRERIPFLRRFTILLSLSVLIAVMGLASDSGPVVIGAMLVSPLTTPLLGLSGALVMGWPRRQLEALAVLVLGSLWAFALAYLALKAIPEPRAVTLQSEELLARTQPRLLDLGVAVVAGAAGAYVLVRREAVGALPGVAIAVALVPPLSAVGMMVELGQPELADDALLLYLTNLAGIVFAAAVVLLLAGWRPDTHDGRLPRGARLGLVLAALVVLAIAYPLGVVTSDRVADAVDRDDATRIAREWGERAAHSRGRRRGAPRPRRGLGADAARRRPGPRRPDRGRVRAAGRRRRRLDARAADDRHGHAALSARGPGALPARRAAALPAVAAARLSSPP